MADRSRGPACLEIKSGWSLGYLTGRIMVIIARTLMRHRFLTFSSPTITKSGWRWDSSALARRSSAQGHSRRFRDVGGMSALPPKLTVTADIEGPAARVHGVSHWLMLWITRLWLRASESTRQTDTRLTQPSTQ
jgi:hypothetical protein